MFPERLVLIKMSNNCMFCCNPQGQAYIYEVGPLLGYITCEKCKDTCKKIFDEFTDTIAYGNARHLKDKEIKVKRSDNTIEDGWKLYYPITRTIQGVEHVQCINYENNIEKWCNIDTIIELNN